jgi:predicted transcriptional regulator
MVADLDLTEATAEIVASYVSANTVPATELAGLIQTVFNSLKTLGEPPVETAPEIAKPTPAQIRKSITPDALISFEDGKPYKTLKRHLATHGLTLDEYKAKWSLPRDYPSTAPSYSERRSAMAKSMGLGARGRGGGAKAAKTPAKAPTRGRPKKA